VPDTSPKPEKIKIDHIVGTEDETTEAGDEVIEIVSDEAHTEDTGDSADSGVLAEAREEIERLKDQYMRARADFENLRKRVERDRAEERGRIASGVVGEILPAIDNLDRALEQPGDDPGFREGVALIRRQLDETFRKMGVEPIEALGEPFNPVFHEALTVEPREGFAPDTIIEEIRKGYTLGGRVIRPSLVKVVIAPPTASADGPGESGESDGQDPRD
jgi:molecular chaperone GrpE